MEAFKPEAGSVTTLGCDKLGDAGDVSVQAREVRDAKAASVRGLLIEVSESQYRIDRSFVDADEIPELLKGLDALLEVKANPTQFKMFEVSYPTRGELELTVYNNARAGIIEYSVKAGRTLGARTFLSAEQMQKLRGLVNSASQKLATLSAPN